MILFLFFLKEQVSGHSSLNGVCIILYRFEKMRYQKKSLRTFLRFTDLGIYVHKPSDQVSVMHCLAHIWCARIPTAF